jgi:outer membrane protein assembly factor BamA
MVSASCGIGGLPSSLPSRMRSSIPLLLLLLCLSVFDTDALQAQPKTIIRSLEIIGARLISSDQLRSVMRTRIGDSLDDALLSDDIQRMLLLYSDRGYAFTQIRPTGLGDVDSSRASLVLRITEGPRARLVACTVVGIGETDTDVVRREFLINTRPLLEESILTNGSQRLRQSGLFTSVSSLALYRVSDSTVGIKLQVQEARSTSIDGVLGYAPATGVGRRGYMNGFLDLGFQNIGGSGRKASLRYQRLTPSTSDLEAYYLEPWLAGWPVDLSIGVLRHDEDSLYVSTHLQVAAALHSIASVVISASGSYDGVTPGSAQVVDASHILSGGLELSLDSRDDHIAPKHGYALSLSGSLGSKTSTDTLGYSSVAAVSSLAATLEVVVPLVGDRLVGFAGVRAREVTSQALEVSDLYRVGGLTTLRGYREAAFFASRFVVARIEPRLFVSSRTYLGAFLDMGALEQVKYGAVPQHKWSAVGYGISMLFDTQIGYIEGAVAIARGTPLDGAVLHLGLRTAF